MTKTKVRLVSIGHREKLSKGLIRYSGELAFGRKVLKFELNLYKLGVMAPVKGNRWYVALDVNRHPSYEGFCPQCERAFSQATADLFFPLLKEKGFKVVKHSKPGGWYTFDMYTDHVLSEVTLVSYKPVAPGVAYSYFEQYLQCPIHGRIRVVRQN